MYIYIYILAWTCAYPCTGFCGSDHVETLRLCCRFVIGVLSLHLFFVSCLVSCLAVTVHRPLWTRSCCDLAVVWSVRRFAISVLSLYLVLFFVWRSIRSRKLSGLASCQEAVRSQVWEAAMGGCQVPDLVSS